MEYQSEHVNIETLRSQVRLVDGMREINNELERRKAMSEVEQSMGQGVIGGSGVDQQKQPTLGRQLRLLEARVERLEQMAADTGKKVDENTDTVSQLVTHTELYGHSERGHHPVNTVEPCT